MDKEKSIIEKLGITPGLPKEINSVGDCLAVYKAAGMRVHTVAQLVFDDAVTLWNHLNQRNELLEALIDEVDAQEELACGEQIDMAYEKMKDIIQKDTGKTWEQIKELLS